MPYRQRPRTCSTAGSRPRSGCPCPSVIRYRPTGATGCHPCAPRRCGRPAKPDCCEVLQPYCSPPPINCSKATPVTGDECVQFCDLVLINELLVRQNREQQRILLETAEGIAKIINCYVCPSCAGKPEPPLAETEPSTGPTIPSGVEAIVLTGDPKMALCENNALAYAAATDALGSSNIDFITCLRNLDGLLGSSLARLVVCCGGIVEASEG